MIIAISLFKCLTPVVGTLFLSNEKLLVAIPMELFTLSKNITFIKTALVLLYIIWGLDCVSIVASAWQVHEIKMYLFGMLSSGITLIPSYVKNQACGLN